LRELSHTVRTSDGIELAVREYLPDVVPVRRNLLFVHGACEHGGRYAELAQAATAAGWRVIIPDHRGHGRSTGIRVHASHVDEYVRDLYLICRQFSLEPRQTAIIGHSFGGLIVARFLQCRPAMVAAGCLLSPFLGLRIHVDRWTLFMGKILVRVWPWYRFRSRVRAVDLSHDEGYLQQRRQDPLIERTVTAGWFFAVQQAIKQVHAEAAFIQTPLLILQGDQDQIVNPQATERWFQSLESDDRAFEMLPGHLHELLQESDRAQTIQRVLNWLDIRVQ
jgi:alpha-beta hydrolase superfamily lysophospholipase